MDETGAPAPFAQPDAGSVAFYRGATLLDGTGQPARQSMTIVADGAEIVLVAPDDEVPADRATAQRSSTWRAGSSSPA